MEKNGCPTAWASLTFGNRIMNKYGVRRRGRNLPALVLLKQLWDGSGQGMPAKNAAGHTIRLSLNLWYHYYGNMVGNGKGRMETLLPTSRLTPVTSGISRSAAHALTYGSNENVRVEKSVQAYGMRNAPAGGPPDQVWNKNLLRNLLFMQKSWQSAPPPLTGEGWGVGEDATCGDDGAFPPTPALPRQGGGSILGFVGASCLSAESAGPTSFSRRQADRIAMLTIPTSFYTFRQGARHAATIINDRLPGAVPDVIGRDGISKHFVHKPGFRLAEGHRSFLTDRRDGRAPLPVLRLIPVTVDISRAAVDSLTGAKHDVGRVEQTSQELGTPPHQAGGISPLPVLISGADRLSPRSHRQLEQIAKPVMQTSQQLFRKGDRQSQLTTNSNAPGTAPSLTGYTPSRFLKSQDAHVSYVGINQRMAARDAAHHSLEAEDSPDSARTGSYARVKHAAQKAVLGSVERMHHLLQPGMDYGVMSLPSIRLIPVTTRISGFNADNWTGATGENGKNDVAAQVYGRRNTLVPEVRFTHEGTNVFQDEQLPIPPQASVSSSGKTWNETLPLVHKRSRHIPGTSEKSPSSNTARPNNSSASHSPALVMDETIASGAYREGAGDGILISEEFPDARGVGASGRQAAIPAAELKRVADSVYKMVEKRIMIERERRGM